MARGYLKFQKLDGKELMNHGGNLPAIISDYQALLKGDPVEFSLPLLITENRIRHVKLVLIKKRNLKARITLGVAVCKIINGKLEPVFN